MNTEKAIFKEDDHSYWLGEKQLISVTQLLKKHGLSTDYSFINPEVLQAKSKRGTHIHKEIEDYIKTGEVGFTKEFSTFINMEEELDFATMESETLVHNDLVAGTADIMGITPNGKTILADIKTSVIINKRACAWQLSLYERLSGKEFDSLYVLHLCDKSKCLAINRIPAEEIDKLLACEFNGEIYKEIGLVIPYELLECVEQAEQMLKQAEEEKKTAEATAKEYREILFDAMEKQGISKWETSDKSMLITRIEQTTKVTIDSTKLKKELPEIAEKYSKTSTTKGYVRITLRE